MRLQYIQQGKLLIAQSGSTTTLIDPSRGKVLAVIPGEISGLSQDETLAIVQVQSQPVRFVRLADGVLIAPPDSEQFPAHERLIPVTNPQLGCVDAFDSACFYPPPPLKLDRDETGNWLHQVQRLPGSPLVLFIASWDNPMIYGWDTYIYDVLQSRICLKIATKDRLPTAVYTPALHLLALASSYDYHFYDLPSGHGRGGLSLSEIDRRGYLTPEEVALNPRKSSVLRYIRAVATNAAVPEMTAAGLDDALHVVHFPIMQSLPLTSGLVTREQTRIWQAELPAPPGALAFSPDGTQLAALLTSGEILLFAARDGQLHRSLSLLSL